MPDEIERKFLLRNDGWRDQAERRVVIRQGYLNAGDKAAVRVRELDGAGWLTIKGATEGMRRCEFEYPIPLDDARRLLTEFCVGPLVEKMRNYINYKRYLFEIDEFICRNAGLVVAEIELRDESEDFPRPDWLGQEVTGERRYYNAALAARPYCQWAPAERLS